MLRPRKAPLARAALAIFLVVGSSVASFATKGCVLETAQEESASGIEPFHFTQSLVTVGGKTFTDVYPPPASSSAPDLTVEGDRVTLFGGTLRGPFRDTLGNRHFAIPFDGFQRQRMTEVLTPRFPHVTAGGVSFVLERAALANWPISVDGTSVVSDFSLPRGELDAVMKAAEAARMPLAEMPLAIHLKEVVKMGSPSDLLQVRVQLVAAAPVSSQAAD